MPSLSLLFLRSATVGSALIRAASWSSFSHVGVITPQRTVVEAVWPRVTETSLEYRLAKSSLWRIVEIDCPHPEDGIAWARQQLGTRYDLLGMLGLGLHRDWQDDDAWWCSEFAEAAIVAAGRVRFRDGARRLTPQHVWMVS